MTGRAILDQKHVGTDGTEARAHGTRARYVVDGCRCPECRAANAAYARARGRGAGEAGPFVPAFQALAHLRQLADNGVGMRAVAKASGVPRSTLQALLDGAQTKLRQSTEQRILAVTPEDRAPGAYIPAGPTLERLHRLAEAGFSRGWVSRSLGGMRIRGDMVTVATARAVESLAGEVLARPPRPDPDEVLAAHRRLAYTLGQLGQEWRAQAACHGAPVEFVSEARASIEAAKTLCASCPVRQPCLELAMVTNDPGVYGGTTAEERRALRAGQAALTVVDGGGRAA